MKKKKIIIITFLITIILMSVGYSSLATDLNINGITEIAGSWDVKITNVEAINVSSSCDAGKPTFTDTSVNFSAKLMKPGDEITYKVTIKNAGTIDAKLQTVIFTEEIDGILALNYTTTQITPELNAGEETTFNITVTYVKDTEEIPEKKTKTLTGIIEYVQK